MPGLYDTTIGTLLIGISWCPAELMRGSLKFCLNSPVLLPSVIPWLSMQVVVDAFIAITLVIVFSRSRTGFRKTDTVLNRLIWGAIQTGLFAGIFSMGDLISLSFSRTQISTVCSPYTLVVSTPISSWIPSPRSGQTGWAPTDSSQATSTVPSTSIQLKVKGAIQDTCDRESWRGRKAKSSHWQSDSMHLELCIAMAMGSAKRKFSLNVLSGIRHTSVVSFSLSFQFSIPHLYRLAPNIQYFGDGRRVGAHWKLSSLYYY